MLPSSHVRESQKHAHHVAAALLRPLRGAGDLTPRRCMLGQPRGTQREEEVAPPHSEARQPSRRLLVAGDCRERRGRCQAGPFCLSAHLAAPPSSPVTRFLPLLPVLSPLIPVGTLATHRRHGPGRGGTFHWRQDAHWARHTGGLHGGRVLGSDDESTACTVEATA